MTRVRRVLGAVRMALLAAPLGAAPLAAQPRDTVTVIGVGDIMMGSTHPKPLLPAEDGAVLFRDVADVLRNADVTTGNLEGVLLDRGGIPKRCAKKSACHVFRMPTRYAQHLVDAGFDVLSLANNHAGDFGDVGRRSSMRTLEAAGLLHAGQLEQPYVLFERDGVRFGFAAYAPNQNTVPLNDHAGAQAIVAHLDSLADVVIVSFHGGAEGAAHQRVPRRPERFLGENRGDVHAFARAVIDAGADIVFGHGPHVTRAVDLYRGRFIAYSLGNFATYGGMNLRGVSGLAPIIKVVVTRQGEFVRAEVTATAQVPRDAVRRDPERRVIGVLRELTALDAPEAGLDIGDDGTIRRRAP